MLVRGKRLYGLALDDSYIRLHISHDDKKSYHFDASKTYQDKSVDTLISFNKNKELHAQVTPTLFFTNTVSLSLPISIESSQTKEFYGGFSGRIRVGIPLKNSLRVETEINSGELVANNSHLDEYHHSLYPSFYYRAYTAFLGIKILCLW
jgi:hypothetical protein